MITLATLEQATAREVFDQVKNHLLTQNKQCLNEEKSDCVYRDHEGLKCAAGCLIADEEYLPNIEYNTWGILCRKGFVPHKHNQLIRRLQEIHDNECVEMWEECLNRLETKLYLYE